MGMTIDESTEVLADYIDTYKICGGNGYNPATNITQEACEAFETATSIMHKYKQIEQIYKEWFSDVGHTSAEAYRRIGEVVEDGKRG